MLKYLVNYCSDDIARRYYEDTQIKYAQILPANTYCDWRGENYEHLLRLGLGGVRVSHGNEFSNRMTAGPGTAVAGDREAASKQDLLRI